MDEPIGIRIWSAFTRLRDTSGTGLNRFGELAIASILHAGDGGTFACHVKERVKKGNWSLYRLFLDDLGATLVVRDGSAAIRWEFAGGIIIDSAVGAFVPGATLTAINAMGDSDELTDTIDEAIFGSDEDEAVLETANGKKFAVFQLSGDGTYDVVKGLDSDGAVVALAVVAWDEDDAKESNGDQKA